MSIMEDAMSDRIVMPAGKPRGLLRLAFRLPVTTYRLRLGWIFGHRVLLVTHRGRRSGRVYRTALEVVRYDPATRESIVAAGFGPRSDWFQNIQAQPALEVETARMRYVPRQRVLTPDEAYAEFAAYARRHRVGARVLLRGFFHSDGSEAAWHELARRVPMVAFRPVD